MTQISRLAILLAAAAATRAEFPVPEAPFAPRAYDCFRAATVPVIDGALSDSCWSAAPRSDVFVDIRGGAWPDPSLRTRARLLWDTDFLYVAAELEEPDLWATYAGRDMVVYHEHDFELFLDPDGDNHDYYELEINALGTVWDLFLTRPYRDDGTALSSWDIQGLQSAVALDGTLNNPGDRDRGWTVELALPWPALAQAARRPCPPAPGDAWRLNFSRVEWHLDVVGGEYRKRTDPATGAAQPEENWVWSPQGLVAMHYPERWGLLRFQGEPGDSTIAPREWSPDELAAGECLMQVYYAQRGLQDAGGPFSTTVGAPALPADWSLPAIEACGGAFTARTRRVDGLEMQVDERGRLTRRRPAGATP